ncbi:MAG: excinuclease ABC subunit UvrC [Clostridia bacterium]|nr:excinuclease ABC subunit UvrC [Clostridia bacterium]
MANTVQKDEKKKQLLVAANELPYSPGVYIMHDREGKIIYVGKALHLKDRVSQYFRDTEKNPKTEKMVSCVDYFECIVCESEIEALTLENNLIKKHTPKYNIKLKDAKSYPYIKLTAGDYPVPIMTRNRKSDGGRYFGPFSGTGAVYSIINLLTRTFGLPTCRHRFPEEIGKIRPCIYYGMGRCCGVCTGKVSKEEYALKIAGVSELLKGGVSGVRRLLEEKMTEYAEAERFESAAVCRDTIAALEKLSDRQKAAADPSVSRDAAAVSIDGELCALSVLRIRGGALTDKIDYIIDRTVPDITSAAVCLLAEHYRSSEDLPPELLLGGGFSENDASLISDYLLSISGHRHPVSVPKKGEKKKLCEMAAENARLAAEREANSAEKSDLLAVKLASVLGLEVVPDRIEAYDISNIGSEHITAGMIVTEGGSFKKSDYRYFGIKSIEGTDDYGAMREALTRRLSKLLPAEDEAVADSSFRSVPDLLLIDGGRQHLEVALEVLDSLGLDIPAAGMVKDGEHRTRALVTAEGECDIAAERDLFVFIYRIQEEIHRYTVSRMTAAKRKTVRHSSLEKIKGIGEAKAAALLKAFDGLSGVKQAGISELAAVKGISGKDAENIFRAYHSGADERED